MDHQESNSDQDEAQENDAQELPDILLTEPSVNLEEEPPGNQGSDGGSSQPPLFDTSTCPEPKRWYASLSLTDWITAISTAIIMVWAGLQWYEMHTGGTQTSQIISAANLIEQHQNQLVRDNKQTLQDNREALKSTLEENRNEVSSILRENRAALKAQTQAAHDQSSAALQSALSIQQQTIISERPWLSVQVQPASDLRFVDGKQAAMAFEVSIKNVGKSIAKTIQIDVKLAATPATGMPVAPESGGVQRKICDNPLPQYVGSFDLFPVDTPVVRVIGPSAIASEVERNEVSTSDNPARSFIGLYVVGCVTYRSSFDRNIYQTYFAYEIIHPRFPGPNEKLPILANGMPAMTDLEVGVLVPKKEVTLIQEAFARNDAN